jgi:enoyl-CoA hydratase
MQSEILFEVKEGVGYVTLNRPSVLNALSLEMIDALLDKLAEWESDAKVESLWIQGAGSAFCAGGDVKSVYQAVQKGDRNRVDHFYRREYQMNYRLATYKKPIAAFMDGIVMGGGAGIGMHCSVRIVTDDTLFAMPECAIGFVPDVGASFFLNRCPGEIAMFLGLTGVRMRAQGLIYTGLATHFVPSNRKAYLTPDKLVALSLQPEPGPLKDLQERIDSTFGLASVREIESILEARDDPWAKETLDMIRSGSPTSRAVTYQLFRLSKGKPLEEALAMEFNLSQHLAWAPDFSEGVRAKLIDKDQKPAWNPKRLEDVTKAFVEQAFQPYPGRDPWHK